MSFLKNMKIGKRLGYGFTVILILSMSITALAIWQLRTVAATTRHLLESPLAKERLIADWYVYLSNDIVRTMAIAKSSDPALVEFFAVDAKKGADESLALKKKSNPCSSRTRKKSCSNAPKKNGQFTYRRAAK